MSITLIPIAAKVAVVAVKAAGLSTGAKIAIGAGALGTVVGGGVIVKKAIDKKKNSKALEESRATRKPLRMLSKEEATRRYNALGKY